MLKTKSLSPEEFHNSFLKACSAGDEKAAMQLLENLHDLNTVDASGNTPLHIACQEGLAEIIDYLVNNEQVNVNYVNNKGKTPLHVACESVKDGVKPEKKHPVSILVSNQRVLVNKVDNEQHTPFFIACINKNFVAAEILTPHLREDVKKANKAGVIALCVAYSTGDIGLAEKLLESKRIDSTLFLQLLVSAVCTSDDDTILDKIKATYPAINNVPTSSKLNIAGLISTVSNVKAAYVFLLSVLISDNFLTLKPELQSDVKNSVVRFFNIMEKLPMEMQMVLANRMFGIPTDIIKSNVIELMTRATLPLPPAANLHLALAKTN
jgi:ankyrin repeat protein